MHGNVRFFTAKFINVRVKKFPERVFIIFIAIATRQIITCCYKSDFLCGINEHVLILRLRHSKILSNQRKA